MNPRSLHIRGGIWEGKIGYSDGHIEFRQQTFEQLQNGSVDEYFIDESPDGPAANTYLSIFIEAGDKRSDFKPIWD